MAWYWSLGEGAVYESRQKVTAAANKANGCTRKNMCCVKRMLLRLSFPRINPVPLNLEVILRVLQVELPDQLCWQKATCFCTIHLLLPLSLLAIFQVSLVTKMTNRFKRENERSCSSVREIELKRLMAIPDSKKKK